VDNIVTKAENNKLRSEKRKLEDELEQVSNKVAKLERKVGTVSNSAQSYKKKFKKLSQKLIKMQRSKMQQGALTKGKHSVTILRGTKKESEGSCLLIVRQVGHFWDCMTFWPLKLKFSISQLKSLKAVTWWNQPWEMQARNRKNLTRTLIVSIYYCIQKIDLAYPTTPTMK
jgi:hypothetical protein